MSRPDFSKLADFFKPALLFIRNFFSNHKKRLVILSGAVALVALLVLAGSMLGLAVSRNRRDSVVDPDVERGYTLDGAKVVQDLYMPGPAVGETPFPLAFEPDPGYTDDGLRERYNDMSGIDTSDLAARRKAELEAIYDALD
ncbi:MAG: hypothetical protein RBT68_03260 [Spirochaetia bacterium]|jgi:hypothetical protein|nr:hypothetical protein [Spirochaetia bacterium]